MRIILEGRKSNINNLAILLVSQKQPEKNEEGSRVSTYSPEHIPNTHLIRLRREIRDKQRRAGSHLNFNSVVIEQLLIPRLGSSSLVLRVELNHGHLGIAVIAVEHFDAVNGTTLWKVRNNE